MKRNVGIILFVACFVCLMSCGKQREWLDVPRSRDEVTLESLKELQALLDNSLVMNSNFPTIGQLATDQYFFGETIFNTITSTEKNAYLWKKDIFENRSSIDYTDNYYRIAYSNIVLDVLKKIDVEGNQQIDFNNIKGQALFSRSMTFFELATVFCKPYNSQTADSDLGLCLRLSSDVNEVVQRSSVGATYEQIINDLMDAAILLPAVPKYRTRSSKQSVYALLSRVYFNMSNYEKAKEFSDSVFSYSSELMDFNDGVPSMVFEYRFPDFKAINKEVLFYAEAIGYSGLVPDYFFGSGFVDTSLYRSYDETDLRKSFFYEYEAVNQIRFRGTYTGGSNEMGYNFAGLGMNEVYLINAECNARLNNLQTSLEALNKLLIRRYERGKYISYSTNNLDTLMLKIITERRKELPFTAQVRWQDLRRLNTDPRFAITLTRMMNGEVVTLQPNDPKYVYPIPQDEIDKTGIEQNER